MGVCSVPGCAGNDAIPFTCNECGDTYCSAHRLPEAHGCPALVSESFGGKPLEGGLTGGSSSATTKAAGRADGPDGGRTPPDSQGHRSRGPGPPNGGGSDPLRWIGVLYRVGVSLVALILVVVLLVGFTPLTMPSGVPQEVAEPIQSAADASAAFVANLTSAESGPTDRSGTTGPTERSGTPAQSSNDSAPSIDRVELEMLVHEGVTDRRQSHGLDTLAFDDDLREIARYHSRDMAREEYFAHTAPDGETVSDRYDRFGYRCRAPMGDGRYATGGENIFMMSFAGVDRDEEAIAADVVEGWMNSPGHRENILREYWRAEGIGVYAISSDGTTRVYVTQNFC